MDRLAAAFRVLQLPEVQAQVNRLRKADNLRNANYLWHRRRRDPMFAVVSSLRCRVRSAVLSKATGKADRIWGLVGCRRPELRAHLEQQFKPGMSWENYGEWEIDHIRPCRSYDLREPAQQYACFHFSNLQPLWKSENRRKSGSYAA